MKLPNRSFIAWDIRADNTIYLIGHFGQSNADGRATGTKPPTISDNVYLIKRPSGPTAILTHGDSFDDDVSTTGWFAQDLHLLSGKNIAIAKWAEGGTQLVTTTNATKLYLSALQTYQVTKTVLEKQGFTVIPVGFVWTQGESDADMSRTKAEYKQALKDLIQAFRTDLAVPYFKCFINELGMYNFEPYDDTKYLEIRNAQNEIAAEDKNVHMITDVAKLNSWKARLYDGYMALQLRRLCVVG